MLRPSAAEAATASDISTRWSLNDDRSAPLSSGTPRTRSSEPSIRTSPPMLLSWSIAATRSDSLSRTCSTLRKTLSPSAKQAITDRIGSMSGTARQSTSAGSSRAPSCRTRTASASGS